MRLQSSDDGQPGSRSLPVGGPIFVRDEAVCRALWHTQKLGRYGFGVSASFDFRMFYGSLLGRAPLFVCDSTTDPSFVVPLCEGMDGCDWFGTSDLEDIHILAAPGSLTGVLRALKAAGAPARLPHVQTPQLEELQRAAIVRAATPSGTKVVVGTTAEVTGSGHWSPRGMRRARQAFAAFPQRWTFEERPSVTDLIGVFDDSVEMFARRGRSSKFRDVARRRKYVELFTAPLAGIVPLLATCEVDSVPAIRALALLCAGVATVPIVALNVRHSAARSTVPHGFRFAIATLPGELRRTLDCAVVDYQGGAHSWKTEIGAAHRRDQYDVELEHGAL